MIFSRLVYFFQVIVFLVGSFIFLYRSRHSFMTKVKLSLLFFKIFFKRVFLNPFFSLKKEKFLGFRIDVPHYKSFSFTFLEIFIRNDYYFKTMEKQPVILDCGANIGMATLFFKWLYPGSIIHAFEPDPEAFKTLTENTTQNRLENVFLYQVGLSDQEGRRTFFTDSKITAATEGSFDRDRMSQEVALKQVEVSTYPLSHLIEKENLKKVDLLKLDIEGMEGTVLDDLKNHRLLDRFERMVIEFHHKMDVGSSLGRFLTILEKSNFKYLVTCFFDWNFFDRDLDLKNNHQKKSVYDLFLRCVKKSD